MTVTPEQIALVNRNIPSVAKLDDASGGYGWTDEFIETLMETMNFSPAKAVRHFWLERVNETAEYLDVGKPLTQIHRQAKEMLDYWDKVLGNDPVGMTPVDPNGPQSRQPLSFGRIERPWFAC